MKQHFPRDFRKNHPFLFWLTAIIGGFVVLSVSFYFYIAYLLPLPDFFHENRQVATTKIYDRHGKLLYEIFQPEEGKKTVIPLEQIPKKFINATLAAEDIHFYEHGGVDLFAIARAIFFNVKEQRIVSGASTIPQQLIRNLLGFQRQRDLSDKILEAMYAVRLSHLYSKDQILELYLNKIYYGNLAYGSQSAALDYFGKNIYDLDLAESAFLAGLPQAPSAYNPFLYFDKAKKRQKYVLDQMVKYQFVTQQEAEAAQMEPLHLRSNITTMKAPHFVHYVMNQLDDQLGNQMVSHGGLSVYTTLDLDLQLKAEKIVSHQVELLKEEHVTNGALLSLDPKTGQILAWVGSEDYFNESIDGAVDMVTALRQPGSSIKPFTYLLALENGYTPATILDDLPTEFSTENGPYSPKNYDLKYHGPVRLRNALGSSYNIPAVKTLEYVGIENFIQFLRKLGIDTLDQNPSFYGLALTLGGGDVRLYDMARAYNVLANFGYKRDLSFLLKIENHEGQKLFEWTVPEKEYALGTDGREHAYQIIDILKDPLARLGGFGEGSVLELSHEAAVKTGTTRNFRDNWAIGFTPQILTAVWVGNADASPMKNISGVDGAGPIWHDFMESAHQFLPKEKFEIPSKLQSVEICSVSGKLPTDLCPERIFEWFLVGSEPKENDDYYQKFWVSKKNGNIIPESCFDFYPEAQRQQKILIAYPPLYQRWANQNGLALAPKVHCPTQNGQMDDYTNGYSTLDLDVVMLDSPRNDDEYLIDPALPLQDQRIPFRVTTLLGVMPTKLNFYVDQKLAGTIPGNEFTYLWLPEKGKHTLVVEALYYDGKTYKSKEVTFEIH